MPRPSIPLGARVELAQTTCNSGYALSDLVRPPGSKRIDLQPVRISSNEVVYRMVTKSVPLDATLNGDKHTRVLRAQLLPLRGSDFRAAVFAAFPLQTPSISEFVSVWGNSLKN